jgi:hypothetical protein
VVLDTFLFFENYYGVEFFIDFSAQLTFHGVGGQIYRIKEGFTSFCDHGGELMEITTKDDTETPE